MPKVRRTRVSRQVGRRRTAAPRAIPPALERFEYQRAGARKLVEVKGASHVVMISNPEVVERLIEHAATDTR